MVSELRAPPLEVGLVDLRDLHNDVRNTHAGVAKSAFPAAYAEIVRANLGPTPVDPDKATEWELGKNQCAAGATPAVS